MPVFAAPSVAVAVPVFSDVSVGSGVALADVGVVASDFLVEVGFTVDVDEGVGVVSVSRLNLEAHSFRLSSLGQHQVLALSSAAQ